MRLSVITINLNNYKGLKDTVLSVVSQSFPDYEYIIVDGGSTDGSVPWLQEISAQYPSIKWISEKDRGVFNAMNKGIGMSCGEYLLFLNSGDYLVKSEVLERVFSLDSKSELLLGRLRVSKEGRQLFFLEPKPAYSLEYFYRSSIAHQATFIHRDLFNRLGFYQEDLRFTGDWAFFLNAIVLNGCTIQPLDIIVTDYNLEGLSSNQENLKAIQREKERIYDQFHLKNIIPDYKRWEQWHSEYRIMEWAWGKKYFRIPLKWMYSIINKRAKKRGDR